ncbi:dihydrodipicolinate synthase family protein [Bacillota bacterium Meth-B3]|nr:dihydrodipicolinate synthase family protein [Christensenellaceae bacterium]MEA5066290.1 dihydrodipicolinate synthase family protein [Eubacteriales bacterium]MEA5068643.1 dihydrodipicolinate synthase family protein [Christensenellaceae bacterium]
MSDYRRPTGSWVAMVTPFDKNNKVDFGAFKVLIDRQIHYGTKELFVLGSAGEATLLTLEEKHEIIHQIIKMTKGRIPVFFSANMNTTEESVKLAQFAQSEGADGVIFLVPSYVLIPQASAFIHLDKCMGSVDISCGIYNNPSRSGVRIEAETIKKLSDLHPNFVADKEAMPDVRHLVQVKRLCGDKLNILCCDFPKYSIVIPTLAIGGNGTANIGGNIIPEEVASYSRPWTDMQIMEECRQGYFKWFPLLEELYHLSNPIVLKAAYNILGLPGGSLRAPYQDYAGPHFDALKQMMDEMGVIKKYGV